MKYRLIRNIFLLFILLFGGVLLVATLSFWLLIVPIFLFLALTVWASANLRLQMYAPAIFRFKHSENSIALTFDDGPHATHTPEILKILDKYNAKATFFPIGKNIEKQPAILRQIVDSGHEVGNHGYSHSTYFPWFSTQKIIKEISETNQIAEHITGKKMQFFRPPFGVGNPRIAKAAAKTDMRIVAWSVRSLDTVRAPETVLQRLHKAQGGDIILLHDNRPQTPKILDEFLRSYQNKGIRFLTVSECLNNENGETNEI